MSSAESESHQLELRYVNQSLSDVQICPAPFLDPCLNLTSPTSITYPPLIRAIPSPSVSSSNYELVTLFRSPYSLLALPLLT